MMSRRLKAISVALAACFMMSGCGTYTTQTELNKNPVAYATAIATVEPTMDGTGAELTAAPTTADAPKATQGPTNTKKPKVNQEPKETKRPNQKPKATEKPTIKPTKKPDKKQDKKPKPTKKPVATDKPVVETNNKKVELYINEIMTSNGTIADAYGKHEDWLEIYNPGSKAVNLSGFYLSDDENDPFRWAFPDVTIPAKGHIVVWASGHNTIDPKGDPHTNFRLKATGEILTLTSSDRTTVLDTVSSVVVPRDKSYGRASDGSKTWKTFDKATPGKANS